MDVARLPRRLRRSGPFWQGQECKLDPCLRCFFENHELHELHERFLVFACLVCFVDLSVAPRETETTAPVPEHRRRMPSEYRARERAELTEERPQQECSNAAVLLHRGNENPIQVRPLIEVEVHVAGVWPRSPNAACRPSIHF